jgi:RNA polymerase sigma factor (sigma-70 family)
VDAELVAALLAAAALAIGALKWWQSRQTRHLDEFQHRLTGRTTAEPKRIVIDLPEPLQQTAKSAPDRVDEAITRLSEREKLVLTLLYYEGLTHEEAAAVLEVDSLTVDDLNERALRHLQAELDV